MSRHYSHTHTQVTTLVVLQTTHCDGDEIAIIHE